VTAINAFVVERITCAMARNRTSDIAETVAMLKDRLIKRYMFNSSTVCKICCAISGHCSLAIFNSLLWSPYVIGQTIIFFAL